MTPRSIHTFLLLPVFLVVFTGQFPCAQEMVVGNDAGVGGRAMGMGGAFTSVADDFSAIYYNPAGLALIRRIEVSIGISVLHAREETYLRSVTGSPSLGTDTGAVTVNAISSFGGVLPVPTYRGSLVFAAGYNRVKEFDSTLNVKGYSDFWDGELQAESMDNGGLDAWSLAGAVDVSPNISLGCALNLFRGEHTLDERRAYYARDIEYAECISSGYTDRIRAWNVHLGMIVRAQRNLRFGATLKTPMTYNYRDSYYDRWYSRSGQPFTLWEHLSPATADSTEEVSGKFTYYVKSPLELTFGMSWLVKGTTLSADIGYLDWSQSTTDLDDPEYFYRNRLNWCVGVETAVPVLNSLLRAGYASTPDPYKGFVYEGDTEKTKIVEKNRKDFLTIGLGVLVDESMMVDIALVRGFWKTMDSPRTDESTRTKAFVTLSYRI